MLLRVPTQGLSCEVLFDLSFCEGFAGELFFCTGAAGDLFVDLFVWASGCSIKPGFQEIVGKDKT